MNKLASLLVFAGFAASVPLAAANAAQEAPALNAIEQQAPKRLPSSRSASGRRCRTGG
jgi:hypothetical protein